MTGCATWEFLTFLFMLKIAILGAGQIGSRHLQALAGLEESAEVTLVDPSDEALGVAQDRFLQAADETARRQIALSLKHEPSELKENLDVAIIACSSAQRADVCRALLAASRVQFVILEKFLFPRAEDYADLEARFRRAGTLAWVNQWLSSVHAFHRVVAWAGKWPPQISVSGRGWGLCCNAVHYIEWFDALTGRGTLRLAASDFGTVFPSKRLGYREIAGTLRVEADGGGWIEMACEEGAPGESIRLRLDSETRSIQAEFFGDRLVCRFGEEKGASAETIRVPMQSRLTHFHVHALMQRGDCALPRLERSTAHHLLVLKPFLEHFRKSDPSVGDACPVT